MAWRMNQWMHVAFLEDVNYVHSQGPIENLTRLPQCE